MDGELHGNDHKTRLFGRITMRRSTSLRYGRLRRIGLLRLIMAHCGSLRLIMAYYGSLRRAGAGLRRSSALRYGLLAAAEASTQIGEAPNKHQPFQERQCCDAHAPSAAGGLWLKPVTVEAFFFRLEDGAQILRLNADRGVVTLQTRTAAGTAQRQRGPCRPEPGRATRRRARPGVRRKVRPPRQAVRSGRRRSGSAAASGLRGSRAPDRRRAIRPASLRL